MTTDATAPEGVKQLPDPVSLAEFLESTPPNQTIPISDLAQIKWRAQYAIDHLRTPEIQLHCTGESCSGLRFFRFTGGDATQLEAKNWKFVYLTYRCWNCQKVEKHFSLAVVLEASGKPGGTALKFGELPAFGPPTPARLITLIGPDRDEFLKGRRCENQGLGVGAFTYYRRVVVNQKDRIVGEIIKVAEKIGAPPEAIEVLKAARTETQFSKALEMARTAMPQALLINGHNPLTLLHRALSDGLHDRSDEECLEDARNVRIVLGEFSERLGQALKDEAELTKAVGSLMHRKPKRGETPTS